MKLYEFATSGNCYKIRLAMGNLGKSYTREAVSRDGGTKTPDFLKLSPTGVVPVLEIAPGKVVTESAAILSYLAKGTPLSPEDPYEHAQVIRWLSFEQERVLSSIAGARFIRKMLNIPKEREAEFKAKQEAGYKALKIMDTHLAKNKFFAGDRYTIADVALYGYTHLAGEDGAGMDLKPYPNVLAWLERVKAQPGHVTLMQ